MIEYVITPEAISEMVFEHWNNICEEEHSKQFVNLEQGSVYYLALSESLDDQSNYDLINSLCEKEREDIRIYGKFNRISQITVNSDITSINNIIFFNKFIKYFQIKNDDLENHIMNLLKSLLIRKINVSNIKIEYMKDLSTRWNYHDKSQTKLLHVICNIIKGKKCNKIILDSVFNIGKRIPHN